MSELCVLKCGAGQGRLAYSAEGGLAVAGWLAESDSTAGFPLLTGLETALPFAAGLPLIGGLEGFPFTAGDALSVSMIASKTGTMN